MKQHAFAEQVKKHFHYLVDDYGFSVVDEKHDPEAFGNSLVDFQSSTAVIRVLLDRGQVLVDIRPSIEPPTFWFDLGSLVEFLAPEADEPVYVFPETWDNYYEMIEWQVARLARVLRQYCALVLRGEFSQWREIDKRRKKSAEEGYRALTGKDLPQAIDLKRVQEEEERRQYRSLTGKDFSEKRAS